MSRIISNFFYLHDRIRRTRFEVGQGPGSRTEDPGVGFVQVEFNMSLSEQRINVKWATGYTGKYN